MLKIIIKYALINIQSLDYEIQDSVLMSLNKYNKALLFLLKNCFQIMNELYLKIK